MLRDCQTILIFLRSSYSF